MLLNTPPLPVMACLITAVKRLQLKWLPTCYVDVDKSSRKTARKFVVPHMQLRAGKPPPRAKHQVATRQRNPGARAGKHAAGSEGCCLSSFPK